MPLACGLVLRIFNLKDIAFMGGLHRVLSCMWTALVCMGDTRAVMQAFCAGWDVKTIAASGHTGDFMFGPISFTADFAMCHFMSRLAFPPPSLHASGCTALVSLIDHVTMGGGAGISLHGPLCAATERFPHQTPPITMHAPFCMRYWQLLPGTWWVTTLQSI
jgi:hypothetical protein